MALGASILEIGFSIENAVHLLTTGAMGAMTLAVMTRASLGHTGTTTPCGSAHRDDLSIGQCRGVTCESFAPHAETPTALTYTISVYRHSVGVGPMYSLRFTMGHSLSVRAWMSRAFMRKVTATFEKSFRQTSGVPLTCAVS